MHDAQLDMSVTVHNYTLPSYLPRRRRVELQSDRRDPSGKTQIKGRPRYKARDVGRVTQPDPRNPPSTEAGDGNRKHSADQAMSARGRSAAVAPRREPPCFNQPQHRQKVHTLDSRHHRQSIVSNDAYR